MKDFKIYYGLEFNPFEKGQADIEINTSDFKEVQGRLKYLKGVRSIDIFWNSEKIGHIMSSAVDRVMIAHGLKIIKGNVV